MTGWQARVSGSTPPFNRDALMRGRAMVRSHASKIDVLDFKNPEHQAALNTLAKRQSCIFEEHLAQVRAGEICVHISNTPIIANPANRDLFMALVSVKTNRKVASSLNVRLGIISSEMETSPENWEMVPHSTGYLVDVKDCDGRNFTLLTSVQSFQPVFQQHHFIPDKKRGFMEAISDAGFYVTLPDGRHIDIINVGMPYRGEDSPTRAMYTGVMADGAALPEAMFSGMTRYAIKPQKDGTVKQSIHFFLFPDVERHGVSIQAIDESRALVGTERFLSYVEAVNNAHNQVYLVGSNKIIASIGPRDSTWMDRLFPPDVEAKPGMSR